MSKLAYQILDFLSSQPIYSEQDWKYISAICKEDKLCKISFPISIDDNCGLKLIEFTQWLEDGFGAGDIAKLDDELVIVGHSERDVLNVVGKLKGEMIVPEDFQTSPTRLFKTSNSDENTFRDRMILQRVQFGQKELKLIDKYIPAINERIIFTNSSTRGLGVVRNVDQLTGEIELYCYFLYGSKKVGYSMHEKGICNLNEFNIEPMDNSDNRQTSGNGISLQRRLNRELERYGKIWNHRLFRIEPVSPMVKVGEKYWYINDQMILTESIEKGTITSRRRYFAGNYFKTHAEGVDALGDLTEKLRDRLALPVESVVSPDEKN